MHPAELERREPAWSYEDLGLLIAAILPTLALAALFLRITRVLAPHALVGNAATTLTFQLFWYFLFLGALYLVVGWKYHRPFWLSLGWTFGIRQPLVWLALGPILAVALSTLGVLLKAPAVDSEIEKIITSQSAFILVAFFGIFLAPVFEELVFRGFLMPLLIRSVGPALGIIGTTIPFALLHGSQNEWAWQQISLIGLAGAVFGYVRYKTGSTAAAFLVHAAYNATGFLGFAYTRWQTLR